MTSRLTFATMEENEDLYYNAGEFIYLRVKGIYCKRVIGKGWVVVPKESIPEFKWNKLHPLQHDAYWPSLVQAGIIKE